MTLRTWIMVVALVAGLHPLAAGAGGRLEINQACAEGEGCFPGDAPGWPVTIDVTGSYLLTSELRLPDENTTAIELTGNADGTSIDLAGFRIQGVTQCSPLSLAGCAPSGTGVGIEAAPTTIGVMVRNGFVRGMGSHGIWLQNRDYVRGVIALSNGGTGIEVGPFSTVIDCQAVTNGGAGIKVDETTAGSLANAGKSILRGNLSTDNGVVDAEALDIEGSRTTGGNVCGDGHCSSNGARRFYLTNEIVNGASATTACVAGYHMASLWEIFDPSNLQYAQVPQRGTEAFSAPFADYDLGGGPPSDLQVGWVRTGFVASDFSGIPGRDNCSAWSSVQGRGTVLGLKTSWGQGETTGFGAWNQNSLECLELHRVWCVED